MTDLISTDPAQFLSDVNSWSVFNPVCSGCSITSTIPPNDCGIPELMIMGGPNTLGPSAGSTYNQYYRAYYSSLSISSGTSALEFDLFAFYDDIPSNPNALNFYKIDIDNGDYNPSQTYPVLENSCLLNYTNSSSGVTIKAFYKFHIRIFFNHWWSNQLYMTFYSRFTVPSTVSSFGFRNLQYYNDGTINVGQPIIPSLFPCYTGHYWNGAECITCHGYCKTCTGTSYHQCTSCDDGYYDYQNGTCLPSCNAPFFPITSNGYPYLCERICASNTFYWSYNQSCSPTCNSPLQTWVDGNNVTICSNRCYYSEASQSYLYTYMYPDGTCVSSCSSPLEKVTPYLCQTPCANSSNYLFKNGSCTSSCVSPLTGSNNYNISYCNSPCPGQYITVDNSCSSSCASPLVARDDSTDIKYCVNPCAGNGTYLYANSSCYSTCPSPLQSSTVSGVKYCKNPCAAAGTFLYNNGTCISTCASPLIEKNDPGVKYCMNPCFATGSYLLPNGSCSSTCSAPLESYSEPGAKYCSNPCAIYDTFLYDDGVCQADCPSPNIEESESIGKFCKYPCANTVLYYYSIDGKCKATCEYPYQATESPLPKLCFSSLSEEEVKQVKKLAETTDTANSASSSGILIGTILSSSDSTSVCMGPFSKMLSYVKYMDIAYPEKVQLMFKQQSESASKGGFTSTMVKDMLKEFPDHELPEKFETYKANSSFFVNFWPALFNLLVILLVTVGVILLRMSLERCQKVRLVIRQLEEILRWNVILVTFCGNFGDIVLFTALEFQTMQFGNISDGVSFAVCLLMNLLCLFVVIKILDVNNAVRKSKQSLKGKRDIQVKEQQIEKNWSSYKALFACYRDQSYFQQIFLFIFIVRISMFTGIIGYLYKYPLLQGIIINLVNILILLYLVFKRPIKQFVNLIQQVVLELVLLPFNMCVLVLAILDFRGAEAIDQRKRIGNIMVYINVVIPVLSVVLMATKFLVIGFQAYKQWKADKRLKKQLNKDNVVQKVDFRGDKVTMRNGIPNRVHTRMSKPQIFVENRVSNQTITNPLEATQSQNQSQLDLSTSQDANFVLNNSINPFIPQSSEKLL